VAVLFTHTSLEFSELGQRSRMELDLFPEEEPIPLSCCLVDKFGGEVWEAVFRLGFAFGSGVQSFGGAFVRCFRRKTFGLV